MSKRLLKIAPLFLFWLASCTHVRHTEPTDYSPSDFWKAQQARKPIGESFFGKLTLQLSSKNSSARGMGQLVSRGSKQLRLEVRDPLGRMQLLVTSNRPSFSAYYPRDKAAYQDKAEGKLYLTRVLGLPLNFIQLQALLLGHVTPIAAKKFKKWKWNAENGRYMAEMETQVGKALIEIDPKHNVVSQIRVPGKSLNVQYSNHKSCCREVSGRAIRMSHVIEVENERTENALGVTWRSIDKAPNGVSPRAFTPNLPTGTSVVLLK